MNNSIQGAGILFSERQMSMPRYLAALTILLLIAMVWTRVLLMRRKGVQAVYFGNIDKKDFLIPAFAVLYFYLVFANAFRWPTPATSTFFHYDCRHVRRYL